VRAYAAEKKEFLGEGEGYQEVRTAQEKPSFSIRSDDSPAEEERSQGQVEKKGGNHFSFARLYMEKKKAEKR